MKFSWYDVFPLWVRRVLYGVVGVVAMGCVMITLIMCLSSFPYGYNSPAALEAFQLNYRKKQFEVQEFFNKYFLFLSPELKESVATEYLDMTNNVLACKYMRVKYIEEFETCLRILFRILLNQQAVIVFDWEEFGFGDEPVKLMEKLYETYGSHKFLENLGIKPMIYQAGLGDPQTFPAEENTIEFFRLWAIHIEKQGYAVYQYDIYHPDHYVFVLIPFSLVGGWESSLVSLQFDSWFERFLFPTDRKAKLSSEGSASEATNKKVR